MGAEFAVNGEYKFHMAKLGRGHELTLFHQIHTHDATDDWLNWIKSGGKDTYKPPEDCRTYLMDPDSKTRSVSTSGGS